jgi:hypothetical protein
MPTPRRVRTHAEGATCGHAQFEQVGLDQGAGFVPNEVWSCLTAGCSVTYSCPDTAEADGFAPEDDEDY